MKKLVTIAMLAGGVLALPAQAKAPHPTHASHPPRPLRCSPHTVGFNARGTLVSDSLTQAQGVATTRTGDDRYSGVLSVDLKRANHKAPTGAQSFSLTAARLKFHVPDRNSDGKRNVADLLPGDRVGLHGNVTVLRHGCDTSGFTPTVTVRKVDFSRPRTR